MQMSNDQIQKKLNLILTVAYQFVFAKYYKFNLDFHQRKILITDASSAFILFEKL